MRDKNGKPIRVGYVLVYDCVATRSIEEVVMHEGKLCGVCRVAYPPQLVANAPPMDLEHYDSNDITIIGNTPELMTVECAWELWPTGGRNAHRLF